MFQIKITSYFRNFITLVMLSIFIYSCSKKLFPNCEDPSVVTNNGSGPGNYFYVMKMSVKDYDSLSKKLTFKRFIFQFRYEKGKSGRNEFVMASYTWNKWLLHRDFKKDSFLIKAAGIALLKLETDTLLLPNVELTRQDRIKNNFNNADSILLVPFYDSCWKSINIKMVADTPPNNTALRSLGHPTHFVGKTIMLNPCPPDKPRGK